MTMKNKLWRFDHIFTKKIYGGFRVFNGNLVAATHYLSFFPLETKENEFGLIHVKFILFFPPVVV